MKPKTTGTLAVIAVAMAGSFAFALFRAAPVEAAYPVEKTGSRIARAVAARWNGLWHGYSASVENVRLRREVATISLDHAEVERVMAENVRLRKALGYAERVKWTRIPAEVISFGGGAAAARRTLRIDKGSLAGICVNDAVVVPGEMLVGKVSAVTPHTSEVLLVSDPSFRVSCLVNGKRSMHGTVSGGGDGFLRIRRLKAGSAAADGSKVVTSGFGGVFPAGIEVGSCILDGNEGGAGWRAPEGLETEWKVRAAVEDPASLEDVFVLRRM